MSIIVRREYDFGTITLDTADQRDARPGEVVFGVDIYAAGSGPSSVTAGGDVEEDIGGFGDLDAAERAEVIEALMLLAPDARAVLNLPAGNANIDRGRVEALRVEAGAAGDTAQACICEAALAGYGPARAECAQALAARG